jgi:16S rRNA (cytosine1402-N4)-methyltransferase
MVNEVLEWLDPKPGGVYVDATVGLGGHAEAILERIAPSGRLIGIDRDADALAIAAGRLTRFGAAVALRHANFTAIRSVVADAGYEAVDGIVMDLGVSSMQVDDAARGFSFLRPGPLDMRMDRSQDRRAADLVNTLSEAELARLIATYGEERWARRIASRIIERRPIETTDVLAAIISGAVPRRAWPKGLHPATRTFQALRIATNDELDALARAIPDAVGTLRGAGRLCAISFHSLDDRLLKHTYLRLSRGCTCPPGSPQCVCGGRRLVRVLTRKPITPSMAEIAANPRARSAKLRACERLHDDDSIESGSKNAPEAGRPSADPTLPFVTPNASHPATGFRRSSFHERSPGRRRALARRPSAFATEAF